MSEEQTLTYTSERAQQLADNYARVMARVRDAEADTSGVRTEHSPAVRLVTVTKFFPASDVAALYTQGVRIFGENRDQEAAPKARALRAIEKPDDPAYWAFIGQLQTNKAKSVVKYAHQVQSVDRASLIDSLAKAYRNQVARYEAGEQDAPVALSQGALECLIQVSLEAQATAGHASEGARGGTDQDEILELAERIEAQEELRCGGIMAVAPLSANPDESLKTLGIGAGSARRVPACRSDFGGHECRFRSRYSLGVYVCAGRKRHHGEARLPLDFYQVLLCKACSR